MQIDDFAAQRQKMRIIDKTLERFWVSQPFLLSTWYLRKDIWTLHIEGSRRFNGLAVGVSKESLNVLNRNFDPRQLIIRDRKGYLVLVGYSQVYLIYFLENSLQ